MNIKEVTNKLCNVCGSRNPFAIADYLGVHVEKMPFEKLLGYYFKYRGRKFIVINSNIQKQEIIRTVAAHELGHAILHEDYVFSESHTTLLKQTTLKFECEANEFAAELLIPDEIICEAPEATVEELASMAHCSVSLFDYKKFEKDD